MCSTVFHHPVSEFLKAGHCHVESWEMYAWQREFVQALDLKCHWPKRQAQLLSKSLQTIGHLAFSCLFNLCSLPLIEIKSVGI